MNTKFKDAFNKTQEISLAQFKQIWALGGWDSGSQQFSNTESWDYLWAVEPELSKADNKIAAELCCYCTGVTNVTNLGGKHLPLNELPENWTEVYIKYNRYKQGKHTVLVARNNHDGTVQLYRVK